jgi:hypothetical protein
LRSVGSEGNTPLYALPGSEDGLEPGVEFFVGGDLVQKAAVDEPDLAGVTDFVVVSEKSRCRDAGHGCGGSVEDDAGRLTKLELPVGARREMHKLWRTSFTGVPPWHTKVISIAVALKGTLTAGCVKGFG